MTDGRHATAVEEQRLLAEAESAAKLDPHIVPHLRSRASPGPALLLDGVREGESLAQATAAWPLPPRRAGEVLSTSPTPVAALNVHALYVHQVAFSTDGTRIDSVPGDKTIRVWDSLSARERAERSKGRAK